MRRPVNSALRQQRLSACNAVHSKNGVALQFFGLSLVFALLGIVVLILSSQVHIASLAYIAASICSCSFFIFFLLITFFSLSFFLSFFLSLFLSFFLSFSLSLSLFYSVFLSLSLSLSFSPPCSLVFSLFYDLSHVGLDCNFLLLL